VSTFLCAKSRDESRITCRRCRSNIDASGLSAFGESLLVWPSGRYFRLSVGGARSSFLLLRCLEGAETRVCSGTGDNASASFSVFPAGGVVETALLDAELSRAS
jgi:hypothetical protein